MLSVGRLCVKTAGRDAMNYCVIVDEVDKNYVIIDGNVRRKKVNILHIEPLNKILDIKKGAETKIVLEALSNANIEVKKSAEVKPKKEKKEQIKKVKTKKTDSKNKTTSKK